MKNSLIFLIILIGISLFNRLANSFHIIIPRPELGIYDVHPFYYNELYLLNNTESTNNINTEKNFFFFKHSQTNIFGFIVLLILVANNLNMLPN